MNPTSFLLVTCQTGAEAALKDELARLVPPLRPSFGRPGFVTFKLAEPTTLAAPPWREAPVFARVGALSLGRVRADSSDPEALARQLTDAVTAAGLESPLHLHVWEREPEPEAEAPSAFVTAVTAALTSSLEAASLAVARGELRVGARVLDVIRVDATEWWLGVHAHQIGTGTLAGGGFAIEPLTEAPSRAWQKIDEAALCFDLPLRLGQSALDLGSAPGGISMALLRRGLDVVGIDAATMSPSVASYARAHAGRAKFRHVAKRVDQVAARDLPKSVDWIICDMNAAPPINLASVDTITKLLPQRPRGLVVTLKLGEKGLEERIPGYIVRLRRAGYPNVACRQLPSNRREVTLAAWR